MSKYMSMARFRILWAELLQKLPYKKAKKFEIWIRHLRGQDGVIKFLGDESKDVKYVIFPFHLPGVGLMATGNQFLSQYRFAVKRGLTPLVDMEYDEIYSRDEYGKENRWETVFVQEPVKDVIKRKDVCICVENSSSLDAQDIDWLERVNGHKEDHFIHVKKEGWREYYSELHETAKRAWRFRPEIVSWCEDFWKNNVGNDTPVIGVMPQEYFTKRFNDALTNVDSISVYSRHPLLPDIPEMIEIVKAYLKQAPNAKVFLASLYSDSVKAFVEAFGDKVLYINRERLPLQSLIDRLNQHDYHDDRWDFSTAQEMSVSYAKELLILSKCSYFLAAPCSGAAACLVMNGGKFQDIRILEDQRKCVFY